MGITRSKGGWLFEWKAKFLVVVGADKGTSGWFNCEQLMALTDSKAGAVPFPHSWFYLVLDRIAGCRSLIRTGPDGRVPISPAESLGRRDCTQYDRIHIVNRYIY